MFFVYFYVCIYVTCVSMYNTSSRLQQESEEELIGDFQWIVNTAPHHGLAVPILHQP